MCNVEARFFVWGREKLEMTALVGNFLFVRNVGSQAALPSVLQETIGKDSKHMAVPFAPCVAGQQIL